MTKANSAETNERIDKINASLRTGDYTIISQMVNGSYKPVTIRAMLKKKRTMNPGVLQEAELLISTIDNLKNKSK